jgi:hypothetical protein
MAACRRDADTRKIKPEITRQWKNYRRGDIGRGCMTEQASEIFQEPMRALTAAGAAFELGTAELAGQMLRTYRNAAMRYGQNFCTKTS